MEFRSGFCFFQTSPSDVFRQLLVDVEFNSCAIFSCSTWSSTQEWGHGSIRHPSQLLLQIVAHLCLAHSYRDVLYWVWTTECCQICVAELFWNIQSDFGPLQHHRSTSVYFFIAFVFYYHCQPRRQMTLCHLQLLLQWFSERKVDPSYRMIRSIWSCLAF